MIKLFKFIIKRRFKNITGNKYFCNFSDLVNVNESKESKGFLKPSSLSADIIIEPVEYRTFYLENLPTDWNEDEIRIRLEQIGTIEKLHIIKNSIGQNTGRVMAIYTKIDHIVEAIKLFKDKLPFSKPVKIRFYREFKFTKVQKSKGTLKSEVLLIKNIPSDLPKEDLKLFLSEFREPIQISYPRDEENEFKRIAYVYFNSIEDADYVLKFANLRYVKNKQLFMQFSTNHFDLTDFRTRAELQVKLDPKSELKLFQKQINNYKTLVENKKKQLSTDDIAKLEYLKMRCRKLEYQIGLSSSKEDNLKLITDKQSQKVFQPGKKDKQILFNKDKSIIFVNENKLI